MFVVTVNKQFYLYTQIYTSPVRSLRLYTLRTSLFDYQSGYQLLLQADFNDMFKYLTQNLPEEHTTKNFILEYI